MTLAPYFHVAVQVGNLDEAMEKFSDVMSVSFYRPVLIRSVPVDDSTSGLIIERRATYSRQGPPYLELVEAIPDADGTFDEGLHHIGLFSSNLDERAIDLTDKGLVEERRAVGPEGQTLIWLNEPDSFYGTRLEFFDEQMVSSFTDERLESFFSKPVRTRRLASRPQSD